MFAKHPRLHILAAKQIKQPIYSSSFSGGVFHSFVLFYFVFQMIPVCKYFIDLVQFVIPGLFHTITPSKSGFELIRLSGGSRCE